MSEIALIGLAGGGAALGAATGFYGAFSTANAQQQQAEFNAKMAERQANQEQANATAAANQANAAAAAKDQETETNAALLRRRNVSVLAQNRADAGALGFDSTGSSLLFSLEQAENSELQVSDLVRQGRYDASLLRYQGQMAAYEHNQKAQNYKYESDYMKSQAHNAAVNKWVGGGLGGASGLFSGAGSGASLWSAGEKVKLWS